jgi:hypothetical protein
MRYIANHNSWKRKKVKLEKGESQSVRQEKPSTPKEATRHTQTTEGTAETDLGWTILSMRIEGIWHGISTHLSYQSMNEETLYQKHYKQHS